MARTVSRRPSTVAYAHVLRADPCCYCGRPRAGTVDHIRPRRPVTGPRGRRLWFNLTAACPASNREKGNTRLLVFLVQQLARCQLHHVDLRVLLNHDVTVNGSQTDESMLQRPFALAILESCDD
jgi:hypothetical protein